MRQNLSTSVRSKFSVTSRICLYSERTSITSSKDGAADGGIIGAAVGCTDGVPDGAADTVGTKEG